MLRASKRGLTTCCFMMLVEYIVACLLARYAVRAANLPSTTISVGDHRNPALNYRVSFSGFVVGGGWERAGGLLGLPSGVKTVRAAGTREQTNKQTNFNNTSGQLFLNIISVIISITSVTSMAYIKRISGSFSFSTRCYRVPARNTD